MKKYIHIKEQNIPIYKGKLVVILSNSEKKVRKHLKDFESPLYGTAHRVNWNGFRGYVTVLNHDYIEKITSGVVAHEALHLAHFILEDVGCIPSFENDEHLALLVEWIVNEIDNFIEDSLHK